MPAAMKVKFRVVRARVGVEAAVGIAVVRARKEVRARILEERILEVCMVCLVSIEVETVFQRVRGLRVYCDCIVDVLWMCRFDDEVFFSRTSF